MLLIPIVCSSIGMITFTTLVKCLTSCTDLYFLRHPNPRLLRACCFLFKCVHSSGNVEPLGSLHALAYYLPVVVLVGEVLQAGSAADFIALLGCQL